MPTKETDELTERLDIIVGEGSDEEIVRKIQADIKDSTQAYQDLKSKFTDYYFDFLSYKEEIADKLKSNTYIPLPFVSAIVYKAKLKTAVLSSRPYAQAIPEPFDPILSNRISLTYDQMLDDAGWREFLDSVIQDCLIYGNAPFQVVHERRVKKMPAFWRNPLTDALIPLFDESGERVWQDEVVRDGIALYPIPIQDFFLPDKCINAETASFNSVRFRKDFYNLSKENKVFNLDKLRELKKAESIYNTEQQRKDEAHHKATGYKLPVGDYDIQQYVTDEMIYWWPEGSDFLIYRQRNPYRAKPFHIARPYPLNGEPYGLSPLGAGHLMSHTINEVVDVIMDGLNLENNKMWVVNEDTVNDFELRSQQNNIVHVSGIMEGDDIRKHIFALETRAIAAEILPLVQFFDRIHQKTSGGVDTLEGIPSLGAETAYENALLAQGPLTRIEDILLNLEHNLGMAVYGDMQHLNNLYFSDSRFIQEFNPTNGQLNQEFEVHPQQMWGKYRFRLDWSGRERERVQEKASLAQIGQVVGAMPVNPVTAMIIENLLVLSGIKDVDRIQGALQTMMQWQQQMAMMEMRSKAVKSTPAHEQATNTTAKQLNFVTPMGA